MNEQRFVVSDVLWQRLEPHLPGKVSDAWSCRVFVPLQVLV